MRSLHLFPPGHYQGHVRLWFWAVHESGKEIACGTDTDADGAVERGMIAMNEERKP
jgi:hypothetical protein